MADSTWIEVSEWEVTKRDYQLTSIVLEHFAEVYKDEGLRPMLLCGSDLLESFNMPGVWAESCVRAIGDAMHALFAAYSAVYLPLSVFPLHCTSFSCVCMCKRNRMARSGIRCLLLPL